MVYGSPGRITVALIPTIPITDYQNGLGHKNALGKLRCKAAGAPVQEQQKVNTVSAPVMQQPQQKQAPAMGMK